ncbi:MAG: aldose 1-epimerase family protein [Bacteroidota bacterium]
MITTLENEYLRIAVKSHGAELCSLVKKVSGVEYLWQADAKFWGRHAPVLFPIVGRLQNDQYLFKGKIYEMKQHGLARNLPFELIEQKADCLVFELTDSAETKTSYPFSFSLRISYTLSGKRLQIGYEVLNTNDQEALHFSIGGHPAFRCPLNVEENRSDYQLVFSQKELAAKQLLDNGIRNRQIDLVLRNSRYLPISDNLFDDDALVFQHLESESVTLQRGHIAILTFHFTGFPYLGIWSKNQQSPFVCIEPWFGVADHVNHSQILKEKEGIINLTPKGTFSCAYAVEIH